MKHFLAHLFLGAVMGAAFTIILFVFVLQPELTEQMQDDVTQRLEVFDQDEPVEVDDFYLSEFFAGDGASCVDVYQTVPLDVAHDQDYEVRVPEGYGLEDLELTFICKTEDDAVVQLYAHELDDIDQESYLWTVMVEDELGWSKYDFSDDLPPIFGPSCFVELITNYREPADQQEQIRLVSFECAVGDAGFAQRHGYVLDRVDGSFSPLYICDLQPAAIVHPESQDILHERHDETCTILYP